MVAALLVGAVGLAEQKGIGRLARAAAEQQGHRQQDGGNAGLGFQQAEQHNGCKGTAFR